ncbi:MAG: hypothetical protein IT174_09110 [Acidobacteria bacterium]|nr:hypothetical protein [Acidobacteriota bacterium]
MKTLKHMLKPIKTADAAEEHFSFRVQDGVEIYEREMVRATRISQLARAEAVRNPRLVVEEECDTGQKLLLTKKRADLKELLRRLKIVTV